MQKVKPKRFKRPEIWGAKGRKGWKPEGAKTQKFGHKRKKPKGAKNQKFKGMKKKKAKEPQIFLKKRENSKE